MNEAALAKYLETRVNERKKEVQGRGIVVTVSRDTGCDALPIVRKVAAEMNKNLKKKIWKLVSKEILEKSAEKLRVNPKKLDELLKQQEGSYIEEVLLAFSDSSIPNDIKIKNTIRKVIKSYAGEGHVIILGRGGVGITRELRGSIHFKLTAPKNWRVEKVMKENNNTKRAAEKHIQESDKRRDSWIRYYHRDDDDTIFDVTYNVSTLKPAEIVKSMVQLIRTRIS